MKQVEGFGLIRRWVRSIGIRGNIAPRSHRKQSSNKSFSGVWEHLTTLEPKGTKFADSTTKKKRIVDLISIDTKKCGGRKMNQPAKEKEE